MNAEKAEHRFLKSSDFITDTRTRGLAGLQGHVNSADTVARFFRLADYISRTYSSTLRVRNTDTFEPRVICRNDRDAPTESRSSSQKEPVEMRTKFSVVTGGDAAGWKASGR